MISETEESHALAALGGRAKVYDILHKKLEDLTSSLGWIDDVAKVSGIGDISELKTALGNHDPLRVEDALGLLSVFSSYGVNLDELLRIDQGELKQREDQLFQLMDEQQSGPLAADNGTAAFDLTAVLHVFIRMRAMEDLCI